jgi:TIGR03009 family protein
MRRTLLPLIALLVMVSLALSQTPPGSPPPAGGAPASPPPTGAAPADPRVVAHLAEWEKVMSAAANFYCNDLTKVTRNKVHKTERSYTGQVMCMKPNLARLRIEAKPAVGQKADPNDYATYISTGQAVYEYDGLARVVTEIKLTSGGVGDNLLLEFMSGSLKAADVVQRFDLKLLPEDKNYIYLEIRPRQDRDRVEFQTLTLVLFQPTVPGRGYLPAMVRIVKPNGQEEEDWTFPTPSVNVKGIEAKHFEYVPIPKNLNWKFQTAQPRTAGGPASPGTPVVRPNPKGP